MKPGKPIYIMVLAAWFGLLFGYGEVLLHLIRKSLLHRVINQSQHFIWMIPLMVLILFSIIGVLLFIPALKWKRLSSWQVAAPIFAFPGFMALYYVKPKISFYAAVILALGFSLQLARIAARRSALFDQAVRMTLPWMFAFFLLSIVVMLGFFR